MPICLAVLLSPVFQDKNPESQLLKPDPSSTRGRDARGRFAEGTSGNPRCIPNLAAGAVIGAALIEVIRNGFVLIGANTYWEEVFVGVIIIIAVLVDQLRTRRIF